LLKLGLQICGASHHATANPQNLLRSEQVQSNDQVVMENGQGTSVTNIGSNSCRSPTYPCSVLHLNNMLLVLALTKNLLSVNKFSRDNKAFFEFHPNHYCIKKQDSNEVLLHGSVGRDGLYSFFPQLPRSNSSNGIQHPSNKDCYALCNQLELSNSPDSLALWHNRLGHPNYNSLKHVLSHCNIPYTKSIKLVFCNSCAAAKSHRLPSISSTTVYNSPLELVFFDVWGPSAVESSCGYKYFLTCVDACTRYVWVYMLQNKSDAFSTFKEFKLMAEKQFSLPIMSIQTDWGGEFRSFTSFLKEQGI
jgi:histone deacetylase 1/2